MRPKRALMCALALLLSAAHGFGGQHAIAQSSARGNIICSATATSNPAVEMAVAQLAATTVMLLAGDQVAAQALAGSATRSPKAFEAVQPYLMHFAGKIEYSRVEYV